MSGTPVCEAHVAAAVAMLGEWAQPEILAAVCGLEQSRAEAELARLRSAGALIRAAPAALAEAGPQRGPIGVIPAASAALLHGRIAGQLRMRGAPAEQIAEHLLQAPGEELAANVRTLSDAARAYRRSGALEKACACLQRALREPPCAERLPELLIELAETHLEGGGHEQALCCAGRAIELADRPAVRAAAAAARFRARLGCDAVEQALRELVSEIDAVADEDESLALDLERELVNAGQTNARVLAVALERYEQRSLDESLPAAGAYLTAIGQVLAMGGRASASEALAAVRRALAARRREPLPLQTTLRAVWILMIADEAREAAFFIEEARGGDGPQTAVALLEALSGALSLRCGAVARARETLQGALVAAQRHHEPVVIGMATVLLGQALLEADEPERSEELIAAYSPSQRAAGLLGGLMRLLRARLALEDGRPQQALEELMGIEQRKVELGLTNPAVLPHAEPAVHALLELGRREQALEMAQINLRRARAWGAPGAIARAHGAIAACKAPRERLALLAEAARTLERSPARLIRLELLLALGQAESACGRRRAARRTLVDVRREASAAGAARLARLAEEELQSLGSGNALTAGEQRIAALAATGLSNREIAQRLHLSVRTVENSLHRVYAKLGCDRAGLLDQLAR